MQMKPRPQPKSAPRRLLWTLRLTVGSLLAALLLAGLWLAWAYAISPAPIARPQTIHQHLRVQIINNGHSVNFGSAPFQTPYSKDTCTAVLTKEPFHFHDGLDQFLHLHWKGLTGGLFLKAYGWNHIGGSNNQLGYRLDQLPRLTSIPIHGRALPAPPKDAQYYVYVGTADEHWEQPWSDFLHKSLEDFFTKPGQSARQSGLNLVVPTALAHEGHDHEPSSSSSPAPSPSPSPTVPRPNEQRLIQINNVLGNVVIFAQPERPTAEQIKARFTALTPLPESSCGG